MVEGEMEVLLESLVTLAGDVEVVQGRHHGQPAQTVTVHDRVEGRQDARGRGVDPRHPSSFEVVLRCPRRQHLQVKPVRPVQQKPPMAHGMLQEDPHRQVHAVPGQLGDGVLTNAPVDHLVDACHRCRVIGQFGTWNHDADIGGIQQVGETVRGRGEM